MFEVSTNAENVIIIVRKKTKNDKNLILNLRSKKLFKLPLSQLWALNGGSFFMIVYENIRKISWKSNDIGAVGAKRYFGIWFILMVRKGGWLYGAPSSKIFHLLLLHSFIIANSCFDQIIIKGHRKCLSIDGFVSWFFYKKK